MPKWARITRKKGLRARSRRRKLVGGSKDLRNIDLVISRYKESMRWLSKYKDRGFHNVHIYNKSDKPIKCPVFQNTKTKCKVHNIPNVGVCDHTYLYHIVHHYDSLADLTIFAPGSADYEHKMEIFDFTINKAFETKDTVMNTYEFDIETSEAMYNFTMPTYPTSYSTNKDGNDSVGQKLADVRPFGEWYKANFPGVVTNRATFFGIMAISREHIHRRPKSFYEGLLKQVSADKFHEASHFMERSYLAMVHPIPDSCIYTPEIFHKKIGIDQQKYVPVRRLKGGGDKTFAIMAIFKNEKMAIREWVDHYKWQGADYILLLDNNSTDGGADLVKDIEGVTILPAPAMNSQEPTYNAVGLPWLREKNIDILMIVDLDEFVFSTDGRPLKEAATEFFASDAGLSMCTMRWTMFGARGGEGAEADIFEKQPQSIRKSFVWRKDALDKNTKAIMLLKDVKDGGLFMHASDVTGRSTECPANIQLNHYAIQSKEFFGNVKMTRGDATTATSNSIRNWDYFKRYDFHDRKETLLKDMLEKAGK